MKQIQSRKNRKCRFTKKEIPKGELCWKAKEGYYSLEGRKQYKLKLECKKHIKMIKGFAWQIVRGRADTAKKEKELKMESSSKELSFAILTTLLAMPMKDAQ